MISKGWNKATWPRVESGFSRSHWLWKGLSAALNTLMFERVFTEPNCINNRILGSVIGCSYSKCMWTFLNKRYFLTQLLSIQVSKAPTVSHLHLHDFSNLMVSAYQRRMTASFSGGSTSRSAGVRMCVNGKGTASAAGRLLTPTPAGLTAFHVLRHSINPTKSYVEPVLCVLHTTSNPNSLRNPLKRPPSDWSIPAVTTEWLCWTQCTLGSPAAPKQGSQNV